MQKESVNKLDCELAVRADAQKKLPPIAVGAKAECVMLMSNVGSRIWQASKVGMLVLCEHSLCRLMCQPSGVRKGKQSRDVARWERIHAWCPGPQGLNGTMREHACQGCMLALVCSFTTFSVTIRVWLGVQVASLLFQYRFWQEVSGNLELFEETLRENCAAERLRHGLCAGRMWNISAWQEVILQGKLSVVDHEVIRPRSHVWRDRLDSIEAIDAEMARVREETAARL